MYRNLIKKVTLLPEMIVFILHILESLMAAILTVPNTLSDYKFIFITIVIYIYISYRDHIHHSIFMFYQS